MATKINFPTDKIQCQDVVRSLIMAGEQARGIFEVDWYRNHHYLLGARDFRNLNFVEGTLDVNYINQDGYLSFRYDDIVSKYQAQLGRLLQMDLNPKVRRKTIGLENMKNATLAQIALTAALPPAVVRKVQYDTIVPFTKYGCVGLAAVVDGDSVSLDVVMPWELVPVPPRPLEGAEEAGIARVRWVPKEWLRQLPQYSGQNGKSINWNDMETIEVPVGEVTHSNTTRFTTFGGTASIESSTADGDWTRSNYGGKKARKDQRTVELLPYVELWTYDGPTMFVKNFITMGGWQLMTRKDEKEYGMEMPLPLRKAVDIPVGSFYGRSFVSTLVPMNTEIEFSLGRLFQNIQDIDAYGILTIPSTLGVPPLIMRGQDGIKRIVYRPDYTMPTAQVDSIQPFNAGTLPAESIKVGVELANRIANQPSELMGGSSPGRVDSQSALGFLLETSNMPLASSALSLASMFSGIYEATLSMLPSVWGKDRVIEIGSLDDAMAGVIIDPETGTLTLQEGLNALPRPTAVDIGVVSTMPRSKEQEKLELANALQIGIIDQLEYVIEAYKKNLDIPIGHEVQLQNYRRAVQNNVILWNDGQTPGEVQVQEYDDQEVHIRVIKAFIARPEFYSASEAVRQAFTDLLEERIATLGTYLEQLPMPEDAALMSQQQPPMPMQPMQPPMQ